MQQVVGSKLQVKAHKEAVAQNVEKKKLEPWMIGVPAVVLTAWVIIFSWMATAILLVNGSQWMWEAWK